MPIGSPRSITSCRRFFREPQHPRQRQYEALRAYFVEERPSAEVARAFGYSPGSFRVLCHHFRRGRPPAFFVTAAPGPRSAAQEVPRRARPIIALRKQNYSVYEISADAQGARTPAEPHRRRARSSRRRASRRCRAAATRSGPPAPRPTVEPVADARRSRSPPRQFTTRLRRPLPLRPRPGPPATSTSLANAAQLPGSKMIPADHALRACLALKLWSIERKSHVMALVADEGLGLFAGLNAIPKKSYLSEYSSRIDHAKTLAALLAAWHEQLAGDDASSPGDSFNLDFHSVPYYGEHPAGRAPLRLHAQPPPAERPRLPRPGRRQAAPSATPTPISARARRPRRSSASSPSGSAPTASCPRHLVFDSQLTTYANLARLDDDGDHLHHLAPPLPGTAQGDRRSAALRLAHRRTRRAAPASTGPRASTSSRSSLRRTAPSASSSSRTSATTSRRSC